MDNTKDNQSNQLAILASQGNQEAFIALYQQYLPPIFRFFLWRTNHKQTSEDLSQDVFVEMAKSIKKFSNTGSFRNWLYTIAKRKLQLWLKNKYQLPTDPLFDQIIPDTPKWIDPENEKLKIKTIKKLLKKLDKKKKNVITLRYLKNYSVKETAKKLKITESNVKVLTHRALALLRK